MSTGGSYEASAERANAPREAGYVTGAEFARQLANEDADIREGMRADRANEPWCPEHGYGCEPQDCPCGHSLRCDCVGIANER